MLVLASERDLPWVLGATGGMGWGIPMLRLHPNHHVISCLRSLAALTEMPLGIRGLVARLPPYGPERSDKEVTMERTLWFLVMGLGLATGLVWAAQEATQAGAGQSNADIFHKAEQSMALIIVGDGGGRVLSVSTGAIIRSDGILVTAYHPLKG